MFTFITNDNFIGVLNLIDAGTVLRDQSFNKLKESGSFEVVSPSSLGVSSEDPIDDTQYDEKEDAKMDA